MEEREVMKETYLGDGLYASFDGWQIRLRAPREEGDHEVFLDDRTLRELEKFVSSIRGMGKEDERLKEQGGAQ